jgi:hypothetical protein
VDNLGQSLYENGRKASLDRSNFGFADREARSMGSDPLPEEIIKNVRFHHHMWTLVGVQGPAGQQRLKSAMKVSDFLAAVARDEKRLAEGKPAGSGLTCASCQVPLQESVTGMRQRRDGTCVCSDCYFDAISAAIDERPIGVARRPHGA